MVKQRKIKKTRQKFLSKPRINFLHVVYVLVAIAVVFSLVAGVFGGAAGQGVQSPTSSQSRPDSAQYPITVVPIQPTAVPTAPAP